MLRHVPLRDVELMAVRTFEGFGALVLSHVHLQIALRVVLLVTAFDGALELVLVEVSLLVVAQDPLLSKLLAATVNAAHKSDYVGFVVSGQVIGKVLRHLESLAAVLKRARIKPNAQMRSNVLPELRVLLKNSLAAVEEARNVSLLVVYERLDEHEGVEELLDPRLKVEVLDFLDLFLELLLLQQPHVINAIVPWLLRDIEYNEILLHRSFLTRSVRVHLYLSHDE